MGLRGQYRPTAAARFTTNGFAEGVGAAAAPLPFEPAAALLPFEPVAAPLPFEPAAGAAGHLGRSWHVPRRMEMTRRSRGGLEQQR